MGAAAAPASSLGSVAAAKTLNPARREEEEAEAAAAAGEWEEEEEAGQRRQRHGSMEVAAVTPIRGGEVDGATRLRRGSRLQQKRREFGLCGP